MCNGLGGVAGEIGRAVPPSIRAILSQAMCSLCICRAPVNGALPPHPAAASGGGYSWACPTSPVSPRNPMARSLWRAQSRSSPRTAGSCRCPLARTAGLRKSLSCAAVEAQRPNRFVTELTSATASATPPQRASLPRFKQGVLCCHRPGRGGPGGGGGESRPCSPDRASPSPLPLPPNGGATWRRLAKPRWPRTKGTA